MTSVNAATKLATAANNGVNVEHLIAAREALTATPAAAEFKWRAACDWKNGTHSHSTVEGFYGLGAEQHRKTTFKFDADHPEVFASEDKGATPVEYVLVGLASCLTAGVAAIAQHRNIQLRSVEATIEGNMDLQGILGIDSDVRNGFDGIKVRLQDRCRRQARRHRSAGGAIAEALGGLRHRHQSDQCHGRGALRPRGRSAQPEGSSPIRTVTTVVIGAGHAGLAMSRCLAERSIDHVVLERGEVANTWRTERWDSLRLLTPNWQSRLPGFGYSGDDPDGYRTVPEVIRFIDDYAKAISAPVETHTTVTSVRSDRRGLSGAHGPRRLAMPRRRACVRRVQHPRRSGLREPRAAIDHQPHRPAVPQSRPARRRRRAGGRRVGKRHADRP